MSCQVSVTFPLAACAASAPGAGSTCVCTGASDEGVHSFAALQARTRYSYERTAFTGKLVSMKVPGLLRDWLTSVHVVCPVGRRSTRNRVASPAPQRERLHQGGIRYFARLNAADSDGAGGGPARKLWIDPRTV